MDNSAIVIKLSGKALQAEAQLSALFKAIDPKRPAVIIHGGGVELDRVLKALGFTTTKLNGLRVSPAEQMPYITAVLAGMCNRSLQALAAKCGTKALGLLATDLNMCRACVKDLKLGCVGAVSAGSADDLKALLNLGYTPIVSSIGIDDQGQLLNINADEAAVAIAGLLHAELFYLSDVSGVLDDKKQLIPSLNPETTQALIQEGVITEGMAVKVNAALDAAKLTGSRVHIASIYDPNLPLHLYDGQGIGTSIQI